MGLGFDRDDLVKLLKEDEEIRSLICQIAVGPSAEAEAHEAPETPEAMEAPAAPKEAVYISKKEEPSSKKQELRQKLEEARKDRDLWKQAAQQPRRKRTTLFLSETGQSMNGMPPCMNEIRLFRNGMKC